MNGMQDQLFGRVLHNGLFKRDGEVAHSGFVNDVATETFSLKMNRNVQEVMESSEDFSFDIKHELKETFHRELRRNGKIKHNGQYNRTGVVDVQKINVTVTPLTDTLESSEGFSIGYRKQWKHNGRFRRNGTVKHDSNVLLPLEE
jgi:hypothetical protein